MRLKNLISHQRPGTVVNLYFFRSLKGSCQRRAKKSTILYRFPHRYRRRFSDLLPAMV